MPLIQSGATADLLTVDPVSKAARSTLYAANGDKLTVTDLESFATGGKHGLLNMGVDYKTARALRVSKSGSLRVDDDQLLFYDNCNGAAYDSNKWIQSLTSFTMSQAAVSGILFNAGNSITTGQGAMLLSHRFFPLPSRSALVFGATARMGAHFSNNIIELGFGSATSAVAANSVNGAAWRKDGTGQLVPVVTVSGGSEILGNPIAPQDFTSMVPATDYAVFEVQVFDDHAHFSVYTMTGVLVNAQNVDFTGNNVAVFSQTHLQAMLRSYNTGAVATAVQLWVKRVAVYGADGVNGRDFRSIMSGMGGNSLTSPTAYTQLSGYGNSAAPASAALSNTAAGYSTLGGLFQFVPVAGAETDYALFAITMPPPTSFFLTGVRISTFIMTALGATPSVLQWAIALNSSAVSLATGAPYSPMRVALGIQSFAASAAQGATAPDISWTPGTPLSVQPGRFLHIILRTPVGTTTGLIRGTVTIDGWFE